MPLFATPGPTIPIQVDAISSWMSPWFQAKLWLVRAGMNAHAPGVAQLVAVDLADVGVMAKRRGRQAVAAGRSRRVADEVIAFVNGEHEERVALVDPVGRQIGEELPERVVVGEQLLVVTLFAGPVREL